MEKQPGQFSQNVFPTKAQMKYVESKDEAKVVSNHFRVVPDTKDFVFVEWHMSFIHQTEVPAFSEKPLEVKADAIPPDSRQLIAEVLKANRKSLFDKIGKNFATGVTLFSLQPVNFLTAIFTQHGSFALILEKKNTQSSLETLVSSSDCRFPLLRFLNSAVKSIFKKMDFIELGMNKKYYNAKDTKTIEAGRHKFILLKGYKSAFEIYEGGLKLILDYSTRIIREGSVWDEIMALRKENMSDEQIFEQNLRGKSVLSMYGSQKIYRIDEVILNGRVTDKFPNP